ncbi:hypothetical protein DIPPA_15412 [Diplonema papillatum]|nr:hypothetical protein DIPPA_15412 [Diplonema papillatum]
MHPRSERARRAFDDFRHNAPGVTVECLASWFQQLRVDVPLDTVRSVFAECDLDRDGVLSDEEWRTFTSLYPLLVNSLCARLDHHWKSAAAEEAQKAAERELAEALEDLNRRTSADEEMRRVQQQLVVERERMRAEVAAAREDRQTVASLLHAAQHNMARAHEALAHGEAADRPPAGPAETAAEIHEGRQALHAAMVRHAAMQEELDSSLADLEKARALVLQWEDKVQRTQAVMRTEQAAICDLRERVHTLEEAGARAKREEVSKQQDFVAESGALLREANAEAAGLASELAVVERALEEAADKVEQAEADRKASFAAAQQRRAKLQLLVAEHRSLEHEHMVATEVQAPLIHNELLQRTSARSRPIFKAPLLEETGARAKREEVSKQQDFVAESGTLLREATAEAAGLASELAVVERALEEAADKVEQAEADRKASFAAAQQRRAKLQLLVAEHRSLEHEHMVATEVQAPLIHNELLQRTSKTYLQSPERATRRN